jgi:hypothetical protein
MLSEFAGVAGRSKLNPLYVRPLTSWNSLAIGLLLGELAV